MKKYVLLFFVLVILQGCLVPEVFDGSIKFTLDNTQYDWKNPISSAIYDISDSSTALVFVKIGQEVGIHFKGNVVGTYIGNSTNDENWIALAGFETFGYVSNVAAAACTIKITEYGNVGKLIKGNFSGRLVNSLDTTDYVILKNGYFEIKRDPDQE